MVSNMSAISACSAGVPNAVTGCATRSSRGSPIFKISRTVISRSSDGAARVARDEVVQQPLRDTDSARKRRGQRVDGEEARILDLAGLQHQLAAGVVRLKAEHQR